MSSKKMSAEEITARAKPGDLLEIHDGHYSHWGVYVGDGYMIHLTVLLDKDTKAMCAMSGSHKYSLIEGKASDNGVVCKQKVTEAAGPRSVSINNSKDSKRTPRKNDEIVKAAYDKLESGKTGYRLVTYNCEHFATECRYGVAESDQVPTNPVQWLIASTNMLLDFVSSPVSKSM